MLDLHRMFPGAVRIASVEAVRAGGQDFVRAASTDGAAGTAPANGRMKVLLGIFRQLVVPYFVGKDARDLEALVEGVYTWRSNYKLAGMPFWNCVAHVELALLDMLGRIAGKPLGALLGEVVRREVPVYLSSMRRDTTAQQEVAWLSQRLAETGARAVKLKIGGRMSRNADAFPGRTEGLIPLARKTFGDGVTIYVDANGSYDAARAVEVGHLLEAHNVAWFEEPCPWQEFEQTQRVADALTMTVAGGEQDTSLPMFRWMIAHRTVDLIQPDLMYNGGMIRCMQVAALAAAAKMKITPHSPTAGIGSAGKLHFASFIENIGPFQEHQAEADKPLSWCRPSFQIKDGKVAVPTGPGLGIEYDPDVWKKAQPL